MTMAKSSEITLGVELTVYVVQREERRASRSKRPPFVLTAYPRRGDRIETDVHIVVTRDKLVMHRNYWQRLYFRPGTGPTFEDAMPDLCELLDVALARRECRVYLDHAEPGDIGTAGRVWFERVDGRWRRQAPKRARRTDYARF
jgi:hypothetical protein